MHAAEPRLDKEVQLTTVSASPACLRRLPPPALPLLLPNPLTLPPIVPLPLLHLLDENCAPASWDVNNSIATSNIVP